MPDTTTSKKKGSPRYKVGEIAMYKGRHVRIAEVLETEDGNSYYRCEELTPKDKGQHKGTVRSILKGQHKGTVRSILTGRGHKGASSKVSEIKSIGSGMTPPLKVGDVASLRDGREVRVLKVATRNGETYYYVEPKIQATRKVSNLIAKISSVQVEQDTAKIVLSLQGDLPEKVKGLTEKGTRNKMLASLLIHPTVRRVIASTVAAGAKLTEHRFGVSKDTGMLHLALTYDITTKEVSGDKYQPTERADESKKTKVQPESGVEKADETHKPLAPQVGVERADEKRKATMTKEEAANVIALAGDIAGLLVQRGQITEDERYWTAQDYIRKVASQELTKHDLETIKETLQEEGADKAVLNDGTVIDVQKLIGD